MDSVKESTARLAGPKTSKKSKTVSFHDIPLALVL
jgi:hypothetical protein